MGNRTNYVAFMVMLLGLAMACAPFKRKQPLTNAPVTVSMVTPAVATPVPPTNELDTLFKQQITEHPLFSNLHIGIALHDADSNKILFQYQNNRHFVPASNGKIFTCYAAMQYLGDSIPALYYRQSSSDSLVIEAIPGGDPTFLHPQFLRQPLYHFLKKQKQVLLSNQYWQTDALGNGWAWDDYTQPFQPEISALPMYGNVAKLTVANGRTAVVPKLPILYTDSASKLGMYTYKRSQYTNQIIATNAAKAPAAYSIPFLTSLANSCKWLADTLPNTEFAVTNKKINPYNILYSQPTDSVLKYMMYESDNFFAEQVLLMVAMQKLGTMNTDAIITHIKDAALQQLPHPFKWVDGCGLSRYNLTTPDNIIAVLKKMRQQFGMQRIQSIFPHGGSGTLTNYYKQYPLNIYAKTGTLSNQTALSGFLITKRNKTLVFSILINNQLGSLSATKRQIEKVFNQIIERY